MSKQRIPRGYRGVRDNPPDPRKPLHPPPPTHIHPTPHPYPAAVFFTSMSMVQEKGDVLAQLFSMCKHTSGKGSIKKKLESLFYWQMG